MLHNPAGTETSPEGGTTMPPYVGEAAVLHNPSVPNVKTSSSRPVMPRPVREGRMRAFVARTRARDYTPDGRETTPQVSQKADTLRTDYRGRYEEERNERHKMSCVPCWHVRCRLSGFGKVSCLRPEDGGRWHCIPEGWTGLKLTAPDSA